VNAALTPALERWLLAEDEPAIRWRLMAELEDRRPGDPELDSARRRISEGAWAKQILATQLPTGQWDAPGMTADDLYRPKYIATNWRLLVLSDLGVTRSTPGVERAVELEFAAESTPTGGLGGTGSQVCFTGNCVRMLAEFGYADDPRLAPAIDWLVGDQKSDGGWHCFKLAFGTIDCWEALAAFASLPESRRSEKIEQAVRRGAEFYLSRGLLGESEGPYEPWRRIHYPVHYYYDFLVGLDTLTRLGYGADPRLGPALAHLRSLRNADGSWNLGPLHPDIPPEENVGYRIETPFYPFALEWPGRPSRWVTVTALAVLHRVARAGGRSPD
jgi:hypothetical protein